MFADAAKRISEYHPIIICVDPIRITCVARNRGHDPIISRGLNFSGDGMQKEREQVASYIHDIAEQLAIQARAVGLSDTSFLLGMVVCEAQQVKAGLSKNRKTLRKPVRNQKHRAA